MRRGLPLLLALFVAGISCAPKQRQQVLRNQMPTTALKLTVEVLADYQLGFGAPLSGSRILTVEHLVSGPQAYWRGQNNQGTMELLKSFKNDNQDLALYRAERFNGVLTGLRFSKYPPMIGEEVYWSVHSSQGTIGYARGWVVVVEKETFQIDGWFHPGTSGAPVVRSDGTLAGIVAAGSNWSCVTGWTRFEDASLEEQIGCLLRRSFFPPGAIVTRVDGWE